MIIRILHSLIHLDYTVEVNSAPQSLDKLGVPVMSTDSVPCATQILSLIISHSTHKVYFFAANIP